MKGVQSPSLSVERMTAGQAGHGVAGSGATAGASHRSPRRWTEDGVIGALQ